MRYQHTNTSHNRTAVSTLAEIAGGMGLRSPQPATASLGLRACSSSDRTAYVRRCTLTRWSHGCKGASFRVPASQAWGFPSLELRAGNSWPLMGFDCNVPEKVLEALYANHLGRPRPDAPRLPQPNTIVQRILQFAFARFLLPSQTRASRGRREGSAVALACANQRVLPPGARR